MEKNGLKSNNINLLLKAYNTLDKEFQDFRKHSQDYAQALSVFTRAFEKALEFKEWIVLFDLEIFAQMNDGENTSNIVKKDRSKNFVAELKMMRETFLNALDHPEKDRDNFQNNISEVNNSAQAKDINFIRSINSYCAFLASYISPRSSLPEEAKYYAVRQQCMRAIGKERALMLKNNLTMGNSNTNSNTSSNLPAVAIGNISPKTSKGKHGQKGKGKNQRGGLGLG